MTVLHVSNSLDDSLINLDGFAEGGGAVGERRRFGIDSYSRAPSLWYGFVFKFVALIWIRIQIRRSGMDSYSNSP